jgi:hypothetical protein
MGAWWKMWLIASGISGGIPVFLAAPVRPDRMRLSDASSL